MSHVDIFPLFLIFATFSFLQLFKCLSGGKNVKFIINLDAEDDDFEIPSDGEVEMSEDLRIIER